MTTASDGAAQAAHTAVDALTACLDPGQLDTDLAARQLASQDVYRAGELPLAVAKPANVAQLSRLVKTAAAQGLTVFVRGAGMSYTDAFLPNRPASIIIDMRAINAIRDINVHDLYVTVEAGCTWKELNETLAQQGVRTVFWGPMSGKLSTIGGALTQGSVTFGSARNGPASNAALGLEVVLGNGEVLVTGSGGQPGVGPFFREYGPDLTGLVCNDAGALGIKAAATLRLEPLPAEGCGLSFSFNNFEAVVEGIRRVSRYQLATEVFGAETALVKRVAGPPDLKNDLGQLLTLFRAADNPIKGLRKVANVVMGGRRFMDQSRYLVNFLTEGRDKAEIKLLSRRIRAELSELCVETANTVAEFTRAVPFPDPQVLGPQNYRLLPLHGVLPYSRANALHEAYMAYLQAIDDRCKEHGVEVFIVYSVSGSAGFLYESVIYWPDEVPALHRSVTPEEVLAAAPATEPNPDGRALVEEIRKASIELFYEHGCIHFQIGRAYPFTRDRNAAAVQLLKSIRTSVDPQAMINPEALGL